MSAKFPSLRETVAVREIWCKIGSNSVFALEDRRYQSPLSKEEKNVADRLSA